MANIDFDGALASFGEETGATVPGSLGASVCEQGT